MRGEKGKKKSIFKKVGLLLRCGETYKSGSINYSLSCARKTLIDINKTNYNLYFIYPKINPN